MTNTFQVLGGKVQHKRWAYCVGLSPSQQAGLCVEIMDFGSSALEGVPARPREEGPHHCRGDLVD